MLIVLMYYLLVVKQIFLDTEEHYVGISRFLRGCSRQSHGEWKSMNKLGELNLIKELFIGKNCEEEMN